MVGCGDLPFDYLEYLVTRLNVPLLYVPGNHDPSLVPPDLSFLPQPWEPPIQGPEGCENIDARVVDAVGLRVAGLGGSLRYKEGANQYSQGQMGRRALRLGLRIRFKRLHAGRRLDVLVTHAPPFGQAEATDAAHVGFVAFLRLIRAFRPVLAVHGHIHPFGQVLPEVMVGATRVVNVVPSRMIEI